MSPDYANRLRGCVTASRGIDCQDPDLLLGVAEVFEAMVETLQIFAYQYENQELNHVDFRVMVKVRAEEMIARATK